MDEVHSPGEIASLVRLAEHLEGQVMPDENTNNAASETPFLQVPTRRMPAAQMDERFLWDKPRTDQDSPELAEAMDFFIEAGMFVFAPSYLHSHASTLQAHSQRYVFRDTRYVVASALAYALQCLPFASEEP